MYICMLFLSFCSENMLDVFMSGSVQMQRHHIDGTFPYIPGYGNVLYRRMKEDHTSLIWKDTLG